MALPTITNNSPAAGSIAWTAFGIQYNGVSYSIAAGNTASTFVWWLYNAGAPALQSGNALPNLGPDDMILFLNKGGVGALVPTAELLDGSLIVGGSVIASAIAANAIQASHISANAVTANAIAANSISTEDLQAGAITTDKLGVGSVGDSLVSNGSFEEFANGMPLGWRQIAATGGTIDIVTGVASSGSNSARLNVTTALNANLRMEQTPEKFIPVSAASGRRWYVSARMGAGTAITNGIYLRVSWYDAAKVLLSTSDVLSNAAMTTTFTLYEGQVTPHASARYMSLAILLVNPNVTTALYVDEMTAREVVVSAIIADGAITTPKMTANTINADRIQSNTITATQIQSNSIVARHLAIGDFENLATINELYGQTVTSYGQTQIVGGYNTLVTDAGASFFMVKDQAGPVPFKNGEELWFSFIAKATAATTANFNVYIYNAAGGNKSSTAPGSFAIGTTDTQVTGSITVPATDATFGPAKQWVMGLSNVAGKGIAIKDVVVRRRNGGELIVDGAIYAAKIATDAVTSNKIIANAITSNHVAAGAITANKIAANTITANEISAGAIGADEIYAGVVATNHLAADAVTANKILAGSVTAGKLETELVLASKIVAGNPVGTHAEMSPEGFRVFADDPGDGIPNEVVRLGVAATDDYFAITKSDGSLAASISQDGIGSFAEVNATDAFYYKGQELERALDQRGRGIVASAYRYTNSANNAYSGGGWFPYLRQEARLYANRMYKVWTSAIRVETDGNTGCTVSLNWKSDGVIATASNSIAFTQGSSRLATSGGRTSITLQEFWAFGGAEGEYRDVSFIIVFGIQEGSGQAGIRADYGYPVRLTIEDVGPTFANGTGAWLDGTAPPPPAKNTYVKQYGCWNSMNYDGNSNQYNYDTGHMYQGLSPAGYGNLKSIGLFGDMTGDLSGATINYVRVYFNFAHWYYNSGGTARIGLHGHTSIPGTFSHSMGDAMVSSGWPKPGARWVDVPGAYWDGFKTGAYRGVSLVGDSSYGTYGYADRPTIEISYTK